MTASEYGRMGIDERLEAQFVHKYQLANAFSLQKVCSLTRINKPLTVIAIIIHYCGTQIKPATSLTEQVPSAD